ncbi:MAG TPA: DUF3575 domain-containing protein [Bacteroidales bacterium]|nr:DUF3575 domain-containing protein [Bacteroidales bacterium]
MNKGFLLLLLLAFLSANSLQAEEKSDSTRKERKKEKQVPLTPYHWNVIKFNPTPMLIQFVEVRNITLTYERLITRDMSLSLQAGYLIFPQLINDTMLNLVVFNSHEKYGVNLSLDYRYYPFSRNRRPAPDGLYIGAYLSYYGFQFKNNFDIINTTVDQGGSMKGKLNIFNLGVSLGYQFIFWKRFSLDLLLFGPSVSIYSGSFTIDGALSQDEIKNLDQETVDKLLNRFPLLRNLFNADQLEFTGTRTRTSFGFRYAIQLGVHF